MKKAFKIIFIIFIIPIFLVFLIIFTYFVIGKLYEKGVFIYKYSYIESVENNDKRYSLYYDYGRDGYSWFIFAHDIDYKKYKEVKRTNVSLKVYNENSNETFIYYTFSDRISAKKPKIEIIKNRYLVFSFNGVYNFLYDIENEKEYSRRNVESFQNLSDIDINNKILNLIENNSK